MNDWKPLTFRKKVKINGRNFSIIINESIGRKGCWDFSIYEMFRPCKHFERIGSDYEYFTLDDAKQKSLQFLDEYLGA